jgi:Xaa-Pro aminopeptidase
VVQALGRDKVFMHRSVVQEMKEVKNQTEISGMREAHLRDCGAAVHFLTWLKLMYLVRLIWMVGESDIFWRNGQGIGCTA